MGMPAHMQPYYAVDEVLAFSDDGNMYELIYGDLVVSIAPPVWHQKTVMRLTHILRDYCQREAVGHVFCVGADLSWGRRDVITQPDVFVLSLKDSGIDRWADVHHVPLIAEVLSPSTARHDRFGKRIVYRDPREATYSIVDADNHLDDVWNPDAQFPRVERGHITWSPPGTSQPLVIVFADLFAES